MKLHAPKSRIHPRKYDNKIRNTFLDKKHSYDSVALEHAQSLLPELKHVIETSELDSATSEQNDLFGFDDV